jgi:mannose-6-phosphate isomerase-like protein (cupin superfamily)
MIRCSCGVTRRNLLQAIARRTPFADHFAPRIVMTIYSVMTTDAWKVFHLDELTPKVQSDEPCFHEFLRTPGLSSALYRLPAGAKDMQAPHLEDEIYFVVEGKASLKIGDTEKDVGPGSILYVRATEEHSFFDITEDLTLLAFFGKADLSV